MTGSAAAGERAGRTPIRTVLFDVDGTLVASVDGHARAWVGALREMGRDVPFERVRPLIGKGGDKLLPEVAGIDAGSQLGRRISARQAELFLERELPRVRPTAGATELLRRLHAAGVPLGVATSARSGELLPLLALVDAEWLMDAASDAEDVSESKPDPDVVRAALARTGSSAAEAVLVGDTRWDVEAASRSGVRAIGLRASGSSDQDLAGAIAIYDGPSDLLDRLHSSPIASALTAVS